MAAADRDRIDRDLDGQAVAESCCTAAIDFFHHDSGAHHSGAHDSGAHEVERPAFADGTTDRGVRAAAGPAEPWTAR